MQSGALETKGDSKPSIDGDSNSFIKGADHFLEEIKEDPSYPINIIRKKPKKGKSSYQRDHSIWFKLRSPFVIPKYASRVNRIAMFTGECFRLLDKFAPKYRIVKDKEEHLVSKGVIQTKNFVRKLKLLKEAEEKAAKDTKPKNTKDFLQKEAFDNCEKLLKTFRPGMGRGTMGKFFYKDSDHHAGNVVPSDTTDKDYYTVIDHDRCFSPITAKMFPKPDEKDKDREIITQQSVSDYESLPYIVDYQPYNWVWRGFPDEAKQMSESKRFLNEKHFAALKLVLTASLQFEFLERHIEHPDDKREIAELLDHLIVNQITICMESQQFRDYFKTYRLDALYLLFYEVREFYDLNKHYSNRSEMLVSVVDKYLTFATSLGMEVSPEELEQLGQTFKNETNVLDLYQKIKKLYLAQGMVRYAQSIDENWLRHIIKAHFLRSEVEDIDDMHILIENYIKKCAPCDEEHIVSFALEVLFSDEFTHFLAVNNKNINARDVIRNLLQKKDFLASYSARQRNSILSILIENSDWDGVRLFLQDFPDTPLVVDNKNAIFLALHYQDVDEDMLRMLLAAPDLASALQFKINSDNDVLSFLLNDNVFITKLIPTPYIEQLPVPLLERIYVRLLEKNEEKVAEHLIAQRKDLYVSGVYLELVTPLLEQKKYELVRRLNSRDENANILELFTTKDGLLQHIEPLLDSPLIKEEFTVAQVTRAFQNLIHRKESNLALKLLALRPEIAEAKFSTSLGAHEDPPYSTLDWMTADDRILDFLIKHPAIINQFSPQQIVHTVCYLIMDKEFIAAKRLIEVAKEIDINAPMRGFYVLPTAVAAKDLSLNQEKERHEFVQFICEDLKPSAAAVVDLEFYEGSVLDIALEAGNFQVAQYFIEAPSLLDQFSGEQLGRTLKKLREVNLEELAVHILKNRPDTEVGSLFYDVMAEVPPCLEIIKILSKRKELLAVHADNEKTPLGCALAAETPSIPVIMTLVNAQLQHEMLDEYCLKGLTSVIDHFDTKETSIEENKERLTMGLNYCRLRAKHAESKEAHKHSRTYMREKGDQGFGLVGASLGITKSVEEFDALVDHLKQQESQHPFLKTFLFSYTTSVFAPANSWGNLMKFIETQRKVIAEKAEAKP